MKKILFCLMLYGSCANAVLVVPFQGLPGWFFMQMLWHQHFGQINDELVFPNPFVHGIPLLQQAEPNLDDPMRNKLEKEARRAQKLETRENEKRAWNQARHHDSLSKKNKWVCQQARSSNH